MGKLVFGYPFMVFHKCSCTYQVPVQEIDINQKLESAELGYDIKCPVCGTQIKKVVNVGIDEMELTGFLNVFKVIPAVKDELAVIKLDTVKTRIKNEELKLYGDYTHLRFWDNKIQKDIIAIRYTKK